MTLKPLVSVIMPAYNAASFIRESMSSILNQTYKNIELVVIDDGSTDATANIVSSFRDQRIVLINRSQNSGLAAARNEGLARATGDYIAWLDSDDISSPNRLHTQMRFLAHRPDIAICGTWVRTIGVQSSEVWRYPRRPDIARSQMLFDDPLSTSSVLLRRETLVGLDRIFRSEFAPAEDYDLWQRISENWGTASLPRILTRYRIHAEQTSTRDAEKQSIAIKQIQLRQLYDLGIVPDSNEWRIHSALGAQWGYGLSVADLTSMESWLNKLTTANMQQKRFPLKGFKRVIDQRRRILLNSLNPQVIRSLAAKIHTALY
jgi:glycosyltransferase involved in cell wall biosynthesis